MAVKEDWRYATMEEMQRVAKSEPMVRIIEIGHKDKDEKKDE